MDQASGVAPLAVEVLPAVHEPFNAVFRQRDSLFVQGAASDAKD